MRRIVAAIAVVLSVSALTADVAGPLAAPFAPALGGKIYVVGGQGEGGVNKPLNTTWEYDPAADAWRA